MTSVRFLSALLGAPALGLQAGDEAQTIEAEIVIYGGTSAGIIAGIQARRMGREVIVIESSDHVGGLTTGGLGQTDIGNKHIIGGISREFYQGIRKHYEQPENWVWQERESYRDSGQTKTRSGEDAMWTFEPSAAMHVLGKMIQEAGLEVIIGQRLQRDGGITKEGARIVSIRMESGLVVRGKIFIDATYEGDLLATAGVSYAIGRESNSRFGESLNGVQSDRWAATLRGIAIFNGNAPEAEPSDLESSSPANSLSVNAANHQLAHGVDPYNTIGDPSSGLLPGIRAGGPGEEGEGDNGVQAYCYRATLTDHPENRIPFPKPEDYDEALYELLFRHLEKNPAESFWINSAMPNRKTDTNNGGGFSSDFIGANHHYPNASYAERADIAEAHRTYQLGLYWTLANHPRVPKSIRERVSRWGLPRDEYKANRHWSPQLYVREARRMMGQLVMTQLHAERLEDVPEPIGMAAYGMDSHHVQRYVDANGFARNEGNVQAHVDGPYAVGRGAILPKAEEADNLIVPVALSASHIAYGSIRMEPVFMLLGQSAATLAALAIEADTTPSDVDYEQLADRLHSDGQILSLEEAPGHWPVGL